MLGSKTMIVLSSDQAIKDLLDKRSAIYSDRMDLYIGQTLVSRGLRILMMVSFERKLQTIVNTDNLPAEIWTDLANGELSKLIQ